MKPFSALQELIPWGEGMFSKETDSTLCMSYKEADFAVDISTE